MDANLESHYLTDYQRDQAKRFYEEIPNIYDM